jgi:hypothetical protein
MKRLRTATALVAAIALATLVGCGRQDDTASQPSTDSGPQLEVATTNGNTVRLYFPGGAGWLVEETRPLPELESPLEAIASELIAGPTESGLFRAFPEGTSVGSVFVSGDAIAYIDLVSTRANPPSSGSLEEMLSVYSVVNSILVNLPELDGVVLLWNGQQRPTFAGHLDTGRPLQQNDSLVGR